MIFEEFDGELVQQLFQSVREGKDAVFHDPLYPYQLTVIRVDQAWEIKIEDIRKRWWGRTVYQSRTTTKPVEVGLSLLKDPAYEALMSLEWVLKADKQQNR